jgi:chromosome segregation ATPase
MQATQHSDHEQELHRNQEEKGSTAARLATEQQNINKWKAKSKKLTSKAQGIHAEVDKLKDHLNAIQGKLIHIIAKKRCHCQAHPSMPGK